MLTLKEFRQLFPALLLSHGTKINNQIWIPINSVFELLKPYIEEDIRIIEKDGVWTWEPITKDACNSSRDVK